MKSNLDYNTLLKRDPDQLFSFLDNEIVMLSVQNGEYYNLDSIGSYIWLLLKKPCTFKELIVHLVNTFEVDEETCINDTKSFIEESIDKGLIQKTNER